MRNEEELGFEQWVEAVPEKLRAGPLWKSAYYRLAMYLYDLAWEDCVSLRKDLRGREIVRQLIRSMGSMSANMEEAFGRGLGTADYLRIMRIALGEAREAQGWYFRSRHLLALELVDHRVDLLDQVIALLINALSRHRRNLKKV